MQDSTTNGLLAQTEQHIVESEQRVAEQLARREQLARHGHDTTEAQALLKMLEQVLANKDVIGSR